MKVKKILHNSTISQAKDNVPDIKVFGDGDAFQLICKASSEVEGWMKSTKAMQIDGVGCIVQVTTQQTNPDGSYAIAEAITFVPSVKIAEIDGNRTFVDVGNKKLKGKDFNFIPCFDNTSDGFGEEIKNKIKNLD
jgi:hypothetical protein